MNSGSRTSFLLDHFREFYGEVIRQKESLHRTVGIYSPQADPTEFQDHAPAGAEIWQRLLTVLERQSLDAGRRGGAFAYEVYREAQYVMVSLADEIFLNLDWPGKGNWDLLESKLFQSHAAGDLFFQKMDRLLQERDPVYMDLAAVYFMALSLGFQGKYRGMPDRSALDLYRQRLHFMIFRRHPELLGGPRRLFPQAYENVLRNQEVRKLPDPRRWVWAVVLVLAGWLLVSQGLWFELTGDLNRMAGEICKANPAACSKACK